jgi:hypothetical protein
MAAEPRSTADRIWAGVDRLLLFIGTMAGVAAAYYAKVALDQAHPESASRVVPTHTAGARWGHFELGPISHAVIYAIVAAILVTFGLVHALRRGRISGETVLSGAVRRALNSNAKSTPNTRSQRSATEIQFLRGKKWYVFWASPPFSLYQAKRRLEFIESWERFFQEREALISLQPGGDVGKYVVENAVDYTLREAPDAVYHLAITHHHMRELIAAQIATMKT